MLIPITFPSHTSSSSSSNAESSTPPGRAPSTKLPPALAKISHDEVVLIELQGSLEVESNYPAERNGKLVGKLKLDNPNKPSLLIGHHLLEGKIVNLVKPLAVLVRAGTQREAVRNSGPSSRGEGQGSSQRKGKEDDDDSDEQDGNMMMDIDNNDDEANPSTTSEASLNQPVGPGGRRSASTTTAMTTMGNEDVAPKGWVVVGIVKKKIVFSKRPMPVIEKK